MKQDIYNTIGKNIQKYRKNKGMKQHDLAQSLFLSDSFIAIEYKNRIKIDTAVNSIAYTISLLSLI